MPTNSVDYQAGFRAMQDLEEAVAELERLADVAFFCTEEITLDNERGTAKVTAAAARRIGFMVGEVACKAKLLNEAYQKAWEAARVGAK